MSPYLCYQHRYECQGPIDISHASNFHVTTLTWITKLTILRQGDRLRDTTGASDPIGGRDQTGKGRRGEQRQQEAASLCQSDPTLTTS